jgi:hypothetical protein
MRRFLAVILLLVVGCDRTPDVQTYVAPRDEVPATRPASAPAEARAASTGSAPSAELPAVVPEGWSRQADVPMRVATFRTAGGADVIISRFPTGGFGSIPDNVNRWRGQVGLPPGHADPVPQPQRVQRAGTELPGVEYDFTGPGGSGGVSRIRVVALEQGDQTWFIRMQGSAEAVEASAASFDQFLASWKSLTASGGGRP